MSASGLANVQRGRSLRATKPPHAYQKAEINQILDTQILLNKAFGACKIPTIALLLLNLEAWELQANEEKVIPLFLRFANAAMRSSWSKA